MKSERLSRRWKFLRRNCFDITAKPDSCEGAIDRPFYGWARDAGHGLGLATGADKHLINMIMDDGTEGVLVGKEIDQCSFDWLTDACENDDLQGVPFRVRVAGPVA